MRPDGIGPLRGFRRFRHTRPFWGGVFVLLAGLEIGVLPLGPTDPLLRAGASAFVGLLCSALLLAMGLLILLVPSQRLIAGAVAVAVSLCSFVLSNLGGFVIGMLLGILGGSLAVGWVPDTARYARRTEHAPADVERMADERS